MHYCVKSIKNVRLDQRFPNFDSLCPPSIRTNSYKQI
jgi:hypothetical protein